MTTQTPPKTHYKQFLLAISFVLAALPTFADWSDATALGDSIEKVKKKYQLEKYTCEKDDQIACQEKFKSNCECFKSRIVQHANKSQTMFFISNNGIVVHFLDQRRTSSSHLYESFMGFVEAHAGDDKPDEVYSAKPDRTEQGFTMLWKKDGAVYRVTAVCPLTKFAGKMQLKTPLHKCYSGMIAASKIKTLQPISDWKKADAEY